MVINGPATRTRANTRATTASVSRVSLNNKSTSSKPVDKSIAGRDTTNRRICGPLSRPTLTPNPSTLKELFDRVTSLEARVRCLEDVKSDLTSEVLALKARLEAQKASQESLESINTALKDGISIEQQQVNSNIVIRGIEIGENIPSLRSFPISLETFVVILE